MRYAIKSATEFRKDSIEHLHLLVSGTRWWIVDTVTAASLKGFKTKDAALSTADDWNSDPEDE